MNGVNLARYIGQQPIVEMRTGTDLVVVPKLAIVLEINWFRWKRDMQYDATLWAPLPDVIVIFF